MPGTPLRSLLVADPGLQRTWGAARATLAIALAAGIGLPATRALDLPLAVAILGITLAIPLALAVSEPRRLAHLAALLVAGAVAAASVTASVLLAPFPVATRVGFVAVMAAAAWATRFGMRGLGLGVVAFMAFFFALFLQPARAQLPWHLAAIGLAVATTAVSRVLLAPSPATRLRHLVVALRGRVAALLAAGDAPGADARRAAERAGAGIDEVVVMCHDLLRQAPALVADLQGFRRRLFAVVTLGHLRVLQAEGSAELAALALPPSDPAGRLALHLDALEAMAAGRAPVPLPPGSEARWVEEPDEVPAGGAEDEDEGDAGAGANPAGGRDDSPARAAALHASTRAALQVAVAGGLAVVAGLLLAPQRWYWAALSTFVVLSNTASRGATLRKGFDRLLGTVAGGATGLAVGFALAGHSTVEMVALVPLLFVGFWILPLSYATMVGVFTVLVALLYSLMGQLTVQVLLNRLVDTALGAGIAMAVAQVLLPARTRGAAEEAFRGYFAALDELLAAMARAAAGRGGADAAVLGAVHDVDRAVAALRRTVQPLGAWMTGPRTRALRAEVLLALTARYWIHRAAARLLFHADAPATEVTALARAIPCLRRRLDALRGGVPVADDDGAAPSGDGTAPAPGALRRADALLAELARARAGDDD